MKGGAFGAARRDDGWLFVWRKGGQARAHLRDVLRGDAGSHSCSERLDARDRVARRGFLERRAPPLWWTLTAEGRAKWWRTVKTGSPGGGERAFTRRQWLRT